MVTRAGLAGEHVAVALRSGELVRLRRGAYVWSSALDAGRRDVDVARARVRAVLEQAQHPLVASHLSAALLHGLPLTRLPHRVHVTQTVRPRTQADSDVLRHTARLTADEVEEVAGLRVTSLARTVVDCLRVLRGPGALVVADAGLRAGLTEEAAAEALRRAAGARGVRRAREVMAFADDGAESAGESYARAVLLGLGLPAPETQLRVDTVDGPVWSDLGWRAWRLLAEYDGRLKYGTAFADRDALVREKRREDVVRDEGWRVLRLTSEDTARPQALLARLQRVTPPGALSRLVPRRLFLPRVDVGGSTPARYR